MQIVKALTEEEAKNALTMAIRVMGATLKCESCPKSEECTHGYAACYQNILDELLYRSAQRIIHKQTKEGIKCKISSYLS